MAEFNEKYIGVVPELNAEDQISSQYQTKNDKDEE